MAGYIYILTDGINTKIGITISLDKRLSAYNTHNPNFYQYKIYDCQIEEAKKIESAIKLYFKDAITGSGKEWFTVPPERIDKIVSAFLERPIEEILTPAMHGVRLSVQGAEQLNAISGAVERQTRAFKRPHTAQDVSQANKLDSDLIDAKNKMAEIFSSSFKLGVPEHRLPDDIVHKDSLGVDIYECAKEFQDVYKAVQQNFVRLPYDDHTVRFYHLFNLASGSQVAVCSSIVSMPYLKAVEGKFPVIVEAASRFGFYAFKYDDWSWHAPGSTALILFMQKTPIKKRIVMWEKSFRRWVLERSKLLEQERTTNQKEHEILLKTIHDVCYDSTFPLDVQSAEDLYRKYLGIFFYIEPASEHFMKESYDFLFDKWKCGFN